MTDFIIIFIFGLLFGFILQYARLNRYEVIKGQARFQDNTVLKTILLTIGVGSILLMLAIQAGWASFHIKPFIALGVIAGGIIFGIGMAILGYCPGTLAISAGEGAIDAIAGILGGLISGWVFSVFFDEIQNFLGPDWGKISVYSIMKNHLLWYAILVFILGFMIIYISFKIKNNKPNTGHQWIISGILLAVLNTIVFLHFTTNRPIGASTAYPYFADKLVGNTGIYFQKISRPGNWEVIFLSGAFIAGLIGALIKKDFQIKTCGIEQGIDKKNRLIQAFIGGFILIFGARMAGGCTSGHIISGGMQLAFSSLVFAVFVFIGLRLANKILSK